MALYSPGESKVTIRNKTFEFFKKSSCKNILSLPNLNFSLEQRLVNTGSRVTTIERDLIIYKKQLVIPTVGINKKNNTLQKEDVSIYDGLFLDLCGPYSIDTDHTLKQIAPGSSVVLTLLKCREQKNIQTILNIKDRINSYIKLFRLYGYAIQEEDYMEYKDFPNSPMIVFFMKKNY